MIQNVSKIGGLYNLKKNKNNNKNKSTHKCNSEISKGFCSFNNLLQNEITKTSCKGD
jgi:hypothetical protein